MSFVKNHISNADLLKDKEILYHLEESTYHMEQWLKALQEADIHYKKKQEHDRAYSALIDIAFREAFKEEVRHVC